MTIARAFRSLMLVVSLAGAPLPVLAQGAAPAPVPPPQQGGNKPAPPPQGGNKPAPPAQGGKPAPPPSTATPAAGVATTPDYVIGPGDRLSIVFWREADMSADVIVRPDGRISVPLLNDIEVTGLTPEQLRERLTKAAQRYVQDPTVTVVIKEINSRKVFISGQVGKPGPYPLTSSMNVLQLISTAGGLLEYADGKEILVMRNEKGQPSTFKFNYNEVSRGKNLKQNIDLKPGDTVIVP